MEKAISYNEVIPGINREDLGRSLKAIGHYALDSILFRGAIEAYYGIEIGIEEWKKFTLLSDALNHYRRKYYSKNISIERKQEIGMPQMANRALSENWLLKEMGDIHWGLLGQGLGQKSSSFVDDAGNRLYAAFVRIKYESSPLDKFQENEKLELKGNISQHASHAYFSKIKGKCAGKTIDAELMTSFLCRNGNDNAQIVRSNPILSANRISHEKMMPMLYTEHRQMGKGKLESLNTLGHEFRLNSEGRGTYVHSINPWFEINGVGLLYFASYPVISDMAVSSFLSGDAGLNTYESTCYTSGRDIFYFANCNANDRIMIEINSVEHLSDKKLAIHTSLYREGDGKLMAKIFTIKQKSRLQGN